MHDLDPGIRDYPNGLFWTVTLPSDGVSDVDLDDGKASYNARDLEVRDFFNIPNALFHLQTPASISADISFDIDWSGPVTNRSHTDDATIGFEGNFLLNSARISWSASNANGLHFQSHEDGQTSFFAQLGEMRNGVFFDTD